MIRNLRILGIIVIIVFILFVLFFLAREYISNYYVRLGMDNVEMPPADSRVLVFAPHNDDEALGCGDFIRKNIKSGREVRVVLITNGDGFTDAIEVDYLKLNLKPPDYIDFGYRRQGESIAGLGFAGVPRENIVFLGYPDGGVSYLWKHNWDKDNPFTSATTKCDRSPYNDSFTPGTLYAGENVSQDIAKIISEYKPTHVVYPLPFDRHPDHWSTNAFVKSVLTRLDYKPQGEYLYLVHYGDWPTPMKREPNMFLMPPFELLRAAIKWYSLDMTKDEIKEKTTMIDLYKSQLRMTGSLMSAFERKSEIFGEYENYEIRNNNLPDNEINPSDENLAIVDQPFDTMADEIISEADIIGVYCEISKEGNLHVFVKTNGKIGKNVKFKINMMLFGKDKTAWLNLESEGKNLAVKTKSRESIVDISGATVDVVANYAHLVLPSRFTASGEWKKVFINAESSFDNKPMDETALRMCDF